MIPPWQTITIVLPSCSWVIRLRAVAARSINCTQVSALGSAWIKGFWSNGTELNLSLYSSMLIACKSLGTPSRHSCTSSSNTIGRPRAGATISAVCLARSKVLTISTSAAISPVAAKRSRRRSACVTPSGDNRVFPTVFSTALMACPWRMR